MLHFQSTFYKNSFTKFTNSKTNCQGKNEIIHKPENKKEKSANF